MRNFRSKYLKSQDGFLLCMLLFVRFSFQGSGTENLFPTVGNIFFGLKHFILNLSPVRLTTYATVFPRAQAPTFLSFPLSLSKRLANIKTFPNSNTTVITVTITISSWQLTLFQSHYHIETVLKTQNYIINTMKCAASHPVWLWWDLVSQGHSGHRQILPFAHSTFSLCPCLCLLILPCKMQLQIKSLSRLIFHCLSKVPFLCALNHTPEHRTTLAVAQTFVLSVSGQFIFSF